MYKAWINKCLKKNFIILIQKNNPEKLLIKALSSRKINKITRKYT
jgi:hypothetical protein